MTEEEIFLAALELPHADARNALLDVTCGDSPALRQRVEALLASHFQSGEFLDVPAVDQLIDPNVTPSLSHAVTVQSDYSAANQDLHDDSDGLEFLAPPTRPDSLGRIDHYEVLQVLGKGGFGIVLRAFDDVLQRVVAIKVMAPEMAATSPARKRFLREARASAQVRHENVVQVYEVGEQPLPYLVMEFIPGETLQQRLDRVGPLEILETLRIGRQIAEGLAAAHAMDLIHRDIKPGNVLLEGSQQKVKITDFGLARTADDASLTQSGQIAGTPMYMAPEQALGHTLDHRVDLFSLGSVLYQMVAGRPPFRANTAVAVLKRVVEDAPRKIREVIPETPQWLCDIIAKLHAKNPDDRYQSAREVADVLADCEAQLRQNSRLRDFSRIPRSPAKLFAGWKSLAVAAVIFPFVVLAVTESVGITHLFSARQPVAAVAPGVTPHVARDVTPVSVTPEMEGWVSLFNGKDLTGWKFHPDHPGKWEVRDGILRGSKRQSHLFSQRGDYKNFHLRAEVKINLGGDSGLLFRAPMELRRGRTASEFGVAGCYEAELQHNRVHLRPTGTITEASGDAPPTTLGRALDGSLTQPDEWFTYEVIADGNHFITKINGVEAANCSDLQDLHKAGHLALQVWHANTLVQFRKIEIKELPAGPALPQLAVAPFDATKAKEHQDAWANYLGIEPEITNSIGIKLRLIPPGQFVMGSSEADIARNSVDGDEFTKGMIRTEGPQRTVTLTEPFYLGAHEVTVGQFRQFVQDQGYKTRAETGKGGRRPNLSRGGFEYGADYIWSNPVEAPSADHPVVQISLPDVHAFCDWLSKREGRTYAVVNEEQWEYACRAGTTTRWYGGNTEDTLDSTGWVFINSRFKTQPVGTKHPNAFGLFDMHGNVEELCLARDGQVVLRGGGTRSRALLARSATRLPVAIDYNNGIGFRVALVELTDREFKDLSPTIPAKSLDQVQALAEKVEEVRKELMRLNPGYGGKLDHKIEGDTIAELSVNTDAIEDISPLRAFGKLVYLDLRGTYPNKGILSDLSPLTGMTISRLDCSSTQISDLSPLADLPLTVLHVNHNPVSDLSPLAKMPLESLGIAETQVSDLSPLAGMKIKVLGAQLLPVTDLSPLKGMPLTNLDLYHTVGVTSLEPLRGMPLDNLNLQDVPVSDLSPLEGMTTLRTLQLVANNVADLSPLSGLNLTDLILHGAQITDLTPLQGLPLTRLYIAGSGVSDLRPLQGMPLVEIRLDPRNITAGLDLVREMKTLRTIGIDGTQSWPPAEFWERYDQGAFTK